MCVRCSTAFETLKHRLWECPADEDDGLFSRVRAGIPMPDWLLTCGCLLTCEQAPASSPFLSDEFQLIQEHLLTAAGRAVAAHAGMKLDDNLRISYDFDGLETVQNHVQQQFPRLRAHLAPLGFLGPVGFLGFSALVGFPVDR